MAKVVKFPGSEPIKFGLQKARNRKKSGNSTGQLNLFKGGRVVKLENLTTFEEGLLLDESGDKAKAKDLYLKTIEEGENEADAYCNLGIIESLEGNHTKAIDCFSRSLKNDPRHFEAHYNLANLYADLRDYALAILHYKVAIEVEPTFSNSYFNLGLTYALTKEYDQAIEVLNQYKMMSSEEDQKIANNLIEVLSRTS